MFFANRTLTVNKTCKNPCITMTLFKRNVFTPTDQFRKSFVSNYCPQLLFFISFQMFYWYYMLEIPFQKCHMSTQIFNNIKNFILFQNWQNCLLIMKFSFCCITVSSRKRIIMLVVILQIFLLQKYLLRQLWHKLQGIITIMWILIA